MARPVSQPTCHVGNNCDVTSEQIDQARTALTGISQATDLQVSKYHARLFMEAIAAISAASQSSVPIFFRQKSQHLSKARHCSCGTPDGA